MAHGLHRRAFVINPNFSKKNKKQSRLVTLLAVSLFLNATAMPVLISPVWAQDPTKVLQGEVEDDEKIESPTEYAPLAAPGTVPATPAAETTAESDAGKKKLTIDEIKIEGNRLVGTDEIQNVLKTKRGDTFVREQVFDDLKAINEMGYFDEKSLQVLPELNNGGVLLKIRVQENAPVTQISIQGNEVLKSEDISKIFADQLGKPQNLAQLSGSIDKVEQMYHDKGFVLARVTDVKDFPDGSVSLTINEGHIDKVEITGNKKTKDYIIRNKLKVKPGAIYNELELGNDLKKLYADGYFQDIRRSLAPSEANPDKFALKIEVDEKRTGSVGLGGGVDSVAGPFGSMSFSDANFRGKGQVLSFNSQVGSGVFGNFNNTINNGGTSFLPTQRTYQIEASFIEPNLKGTKNSLAVSGFGRNYASMMIDQSTQRTIGANATLSRPLGKHLTANLGLMGENTGLKDLGSLLGSQSVLNSMADRALATGRAATAAGAQTLAGQVRSDQLRGGTFFTVSPSLVYDTRDSYMDPKKGTNARISGGPSVGLNGASFGKMGGSVSHYKQLGKGFTLATNAQGGASVGGLPQFAQYRLGGWNGLRGYRQFSDLGTGTAMLMATAEIRHALPFASSTNVGRLINKHVQAAAFFDVGQVTGNGMSNSLLSRSNMGASVGLGLRVKVPMVGLVRLDYGLPLIQSVLNGGLTPRFTVGFGEKF
ncbi:MAG: BamA/TamA family outer membrane protein [Candidatus Melainabacteria bacterium]|nr:BamA/TamA family outer membrane protein [Candidatus Melainabacteria bacterium]